MCVDALLSWTAPQELQQKTLEEVRREAYKLQQQGKNAQHDNLSQRRRKTQITSAQLAKQSSSLLLHEELAVEEDDDDDNAAIAEPVVAPTSPDKQNDSAVVPNGTAAPLDDTAKFATRIKSIIQEYTSIVDIEEAAACVRELPSGPCHAEFAEQTINLSLEGKTEERELAVTLLVGLYERGALTAMEIEAALMAVAEFLEDLRIDIPLVHQYAALLLGRLIAAGCFGISWMLAHPLAHVVECGLAAAVFVDVLAVLELDSDLRSVRRMLVDEEIAVASVLPATATVGGVRGRSNDTPAVHQFLVEHGIEDFFSADNANNDDVHGVADDDDGCDELAPEVATKMRATLEEYLAVKDLAELVACVDELATDEVVARDRWMHFVHVAASFALDHTPAVREAVGVLLVQLWEREHATSDDVEVALEAVLAQYEELRVDIPTLGVNLGTLWAPLFHQHALALGWLRAGTRHLAAAGLAAEIVSALLSALETRFGAVGLREWWAKQLDARDGLWNELLDGPGTVVAHADLVQWKQVLEQ